MVDANTENNQEQTANAATAVDISSGLKGFGDIKLNMKVLLGSIKMPLGQYLKITRGSIVELGKSRSEPLDVLVNNKKVAEGEIYLPKESEKVGVEILNIYKPKKF